MEIVSEFKNHVDIVNAIDQDVYHETELLLKLYRKVLFRVNQKLDQVQEESCESTRKDLSDYINSIVEFDSKKKKQKICERLISMGTSLCLLEVMEDALIILKDYPDDGELYYRIIRLSYFDSIKSTHEEIMEYCNLASTTYFRRRIKAIKTYAAMLWGYILPELGESVPKSLATRQQHLERQ